MLGEKLRDVAQTASLMIDYKKQQKIYDFHYSFGEDLVGFPAYQEVALILSKIRYSDGLTEDIVTLTIDPADQNQLIYLTMSGVNFTGERVVQSKYTREAFKTAKAVYTSIYDDRDGRWISAYAPIIREDGSVYGLLQLDYNVSTEVQSTKDIIFRIIVAVFLLTLLLAAILSVQLGIRFSRPLRTLSKAVAEFSDGEMKTELPILKGYDELSVLIDSFKSMAVQIDAVRRSQSEFIDVLLVQKEDGVREYRNINFILGRVLDIMDQGLLIVDRDCRVLPFYSKVSEKIFDQNPDGIFLWDIFERSNHSTSEMKAERTKLWAQKAFETTDGLDGLFDGAPKHYYHRLGLTIDLTYTPVYDKKRELSHFIVLATDKTSEVRAIRKAKEKEDYAKTIMAMAKNRIRIGHFLQKATELSRKIKLNVIDNEYDLQKVMAVLSILKTEAKLYSAAYLESEISDLQVAIAKTDENSKERLTVLNKGLSRIEEIIGLIRKEKRMLFKELGDDEAPILPIYQYRIEEFSDWLKIKNINEEVISNYYKSFMKVEIFTYFAHYNDFAQILSTEQGKKLLPIKFVNTESRIDMRHNDETFSPLINAIKASIIYCIEPPKERESFGKSVEGQIEFKVSVDEKNKMLNVIIRDDGKGIDPIVFKELYALDPWFYKCKSDHDTLMIICDHLPQKTTNVKLYEFCELINSLAIEIRARGGDVQIASQIGQGIEYQITLPLVM